MSTSRGARETGLQKKRNAGTLESWQLMQRLEQHVADLVRSSQTIASMSQAVEELVLNSTSIIFAVYDAIKNNLAIRR